jgi:NADP-dependent 3-hydroxy acid dehydrogenase YdfG
MTQELAVVTGAARGIGEAIAWRLTRSGRAILLADIDDSVLQVAAQLRQSGFAVRLRDGSARQRRAGAAA